MADISINPLNFNYKQYDPAPASVLVRFSNLPTNDVAVFNKPSWIDVAEAVVIDDNTADVLFTINTSEASLLTAGNYTIVLEIGTLTTPFEKEGDLTVNLTLTETVFLDITPENISFNYTAGGALPSSKLVTLRSESTWSVLVSDAWLSTSVSSGVDDGSFSVSVNPSGLATATHTGTVTVTDNSTTKTIAVSLVVSDGSTLEDYLYVTPTEIEFVKNLGSTINPEKIITLNSSDVWTATVSETWLVLNTYTGSSGSDVLILSLDVTGLSAGTYTAEISIVSGTILRKVYVSFYYNDAVITVPESGVYFAKDDVRLLLSSDNVNSFLEVDFKAVFNDISELYTKKAPFIKGDASVNVGEEVADFIETPVLDAGFSSRITTLIKPVDISFTAYEKDYFTNKLFDAVERNSLYFFNGKSPVVENVFCYVPNVITVSREAVVALHIYSTVNPSTIVISGAISKEISVNDSAGSNVYSGFINLSEFNLKELDVITVSFGLLKVTVRIKAPDAESVMLCFENEYNLPDLFELTGGLTIGETAGYSYQKVQIENNVHEQIYEALPGATFSINTGFIESAPEVAWLKKILSSEKMYLRIFGELIEVIPTFKTLNTYVSREHQKNFKLTFRKAIV